MSLSLFLASFYNSDLCFCLVRLLLLPLLRHGVGLHLRDVEQALNLSLFILGLAQLHLTFAQVFVLLRFVCLPLCLGLRLLLCSN